MTAYDRSVKVVAWLMMAASTERSTTLARGPRAGAIIAAFGGLCAERKFPMDELAVARQRRREARGTTLAQGVDELAQSLAKLGHRLAAGIDDPSLRVRADMALARIDAASAAIGGRDG